MKKHMRRRMKYLLAASLLFAGFSPLSVFAKASGEAKLEVNNHDVNVTLTIPEGKTETITSLRLRLYVTEQSGKMREPVFTFAKSVNSTVKDAAISKSGDNSYIADLIISGKENQDIFHDTETAQIGTLSLSADGTFYAQVGVCKENVDKEEVPVVEYVDSSGIQAQKVILTNAEPVYVGEEVPEPTATPIPTAPPEPTTPPQPPVDPQPTQAPDIPTVTPAPTETPAPSVTPAPTDAPVPTQAPPVEFNKKTKPKAAASVKNGSNRVSFTWKKVPGADGYQIYSYNSKTKKYERMKTVLVPDQTSYSKALSYGKGYAFKVRAFEVKENGKRTYGAFSSVIKVKTAPAKVAAVTAKSLKKAQATISWKKVSGAKGYQIYRSEKKNGTYSRIKTITNGSTVRYTNGKLKSGKTYYYKVRAFVIDPNGKRIYGSFSSIKSVKVKK